MHRLTSYSDPCIDTELCVLDTTYVLKSSIHSFPQKHALQNALVVTIHTVVRITLTCMCVCISFVSKVASMRKNLIELL